MSLHLLRQREASLPLFLAACAGIFSATQGASAHAAELTGSAALTTDYVFRGISQTQGDPAMQAGARLAAASGLYGAVWGSTVEFAGDTGASSEIDYVLGWGGSLADDWALDVSVTWFDYPGSRAELDYPELVGTLTLRDAWWLTVGFSPDVFASDGNGVYAQLGGKFPVNDALRLEAAVAHYDLDDAYGDSYSHAQLGAVWAFKAPLELRVTAHGTDASAKTLFPGLAGTRIEAALQASF
ncbi:MULTISPECIES: TorF family putative porin [unclassified Luteimonas]